jgi:iron-sulfur cluster repair protein YtfE (RIC family)
VRRIVEEGVMITIDEQLKAVTGSETINELVARAPRVLPVLQRYGIDTCCGGALPLATVAERHGLDLAALVAALQREIEGVP